MPRRRPPAPRTYSLEERIALVTEIDARYRAGEGSLRAIAQKLGTTDSNFYNWRRAGLIAKPVAPEPVVAPKAKVQPSYSAADRARILAEVECLREAGQGLEAACKAVGIARTTWRCWREAAAPAPAMRAVEITALVPVAPAPPPALTLAPPRPVASGSGGLTLLAPGGYRVEGLAVETLAQLLRALA